MAPNDPVAGGTQKSKDSSDFIQRMKSVLDGLGTDVSPTNIIGKNKIQIDTLLRGIVKDVDNPILKDFGIDMVNFLSKFYAQEPICCLIKNLVTTILSAEDLKNLSRYINGEARNEELISKVDGILGIIDSLIMIIDVIITILQMDIRDIVIPIIDFSALIMDSILGAVLITLQEIIFTLRDTAITWVTDAISDMTDENILKCLPFSDLIGIIRKYLHDYGILADWFEKMSSGYTAKLHHKAKLKFDSNYVANIKTLEFLKWLRNILVKLKASTIDWELCIGLDVTEPVFDSENYSTQVDNPNDMLKNILGVAEQPSTQYKKDSIIADNGTILKNSEVSAFLVSKLGFPTDIAEQLSGLSLSDKNIQGTLSDDPHMTGNDCAYTMDPNELLRTIISLNQRIK